MDTKKGLSFGSEGELVSGLTEAGEYRWVEEFKGLSEAGWEEMGGGAGGVCGVVLCSVV